jgi:hypothetical protein
LAPVVEAVVGVLGVDLVEILLREPGLVLHERLEDHEQDLAEPCVRLLGIERLRGCEGK